MDKRDKIMTDYYQKGMIKYRFSQEKCMHKPNGIRQMPQKDVTMQLQELGLNRYESYVYLTLVNEGISTAKQVADITGIPYGKVYEIIRSLTDKAFCRTIPSKPMKYAANSPKRVIGEIRKEQQSQLETLERSIVDTLEPIYAQNTPSAHSKCAFLTMNGRSNMVKKIEDMIQEAKGSLFIHCSANCLSRLIYHKSRLLEAYERGVNILIACVVDECNIQEASTLRFCQIRKICSSTNDFFSRDGEECLIVHARPDDDNLTFGRDMGISISGESFTSFQDQLFLNCFEAARALDSTRGDDLSHTGTHIRAEP